MESFPATMFMQVSGIAGHQYPAFAKHPTGDWAPGKCISAADRDEWESFYEHIQGIFTRLELTAAVATLRKMRACLADPAGTYGKFFAFGEELSSRMKDEMQLRSLFALTMKEAGYYNRPLEGWEETIARFPGATSDIEEAHKCFALGRYTASVFHSLQIVETGIIALGAMLVTPDPLKGWSATTGRLKKILAAKYPDRTAFQRANGAFLEQIDATTEALKTAWRNKVSHAEGKLLLLSGDFTPAIAEEILYASRSFMRRLAADMPASPDPDA
jgi:hypothetical protein